MLYYLFRYLEQFGVKGAGMWQYISFRSLLTLVLSLLISMWFGQYFIRWMHAHGGNEAQRNADVDPYGVEKKGVPTMGGVIIIVATVLPCLLLGRLRNIYLLLILGTTLWLGMLGFIDDYIKMKVSKDGLRPIFKLLGQAVLGLAVGLTLWLSPDAVIRENITTERQGVESVVVHKSSPVKSTVTTIPFVKDNNLDYSEVVGFLGKYKNAGGWVIFVLMTVFVVMAVSNGSNMNDGMDGMCAGNSAIICIALGVLAYVSSHIQFASYLNIMFVPGSEELVIFLCAFMGALIGFLWYNAYPAQVFMGDTGSLTLGYIISFFVIKYCMYVPGEDMQAYGSPVVVAFSLLLVPCLDVVRVVLKRARLGHPLFMPDKNHIHHKFLDMGFTPRRALITIQFMSAAFCAFSFVAVRYMDNTLVFVTDIVVWTLLNIWFNKIINKRLYGK